MNKTKLTSMSVLVAALFLLSVLPVTTTVFATHSPPCTTTITGENVGNNAIQTAIKSASSGAVICVSSGTYPEQLSITKDLVLRGLGTSLHPTLIQPTSLIPNTIDPDTSAPTADIILAGLALVGLTGVVIQNLVVDGSKAESSFTGCGVDYNGIGFLNAGGSILSNTVENILLPVSLAGCQPGDAITVQTQIGSYGVVIENNHAINYNKNGITCNDPDTSCWVSWNTVYPYAPYTALIAPNGIQIGFGAKGWVTDNTVTGNVCTLISVCGSNPFTQTESCGILTYESATGTTVNDNKLQANQLGACLVNDQATANSNNFHGNTVAGLYVYDSPNTYSASKNTFNGNPIGIIVQSDGCTTASSPNCINNANPGYTGSYTANIGKSSFSSTPTKVEIATMDGTATGAVIVHFLGQTYSVSGTETVTIV